MAGLAGCDPSLSIVLENAGARLEREAAELAAVLVQLKGLEAEMNWRSASAERFHTRATALADDVSRALSRAQDAVTVAEMTRRRLMPVVPWAC